MTLKGSLKRITKSTTFVLICIWIVIVIIFQLINSNYLTGDCIRNIMYDCSLSGMLTIGIGCILISGNSDLSAGGVGCMAGCLIAILLRDGVSLAPALIITLLYGAVAGTLNAIFVYALRMMPFIATLAMASVWRGLAYIITGNYNVVISNETFWKLGTTRILQMPLPFVIMVILVIIYGIILSRTFFGRTIYMMGGNRQAARLAGISSSKLGTILFINSSVISSLGGILLAAKLHNGSPTSVNGTELEAITAAVLGGIAFTGGSGGMLGAFCGLLLLNSFNNGLNIAGLSAYWQMLASGLMLIIALILDYYNKKNVVK